MRAFALAILITLSVTSCMMPTPDPPNARMSDGVAENRMMAISFSTAHLIINPTAVATFWVENYKSCIPHGWVPSVGDTYPDLDKKIPLIATATNDSIQLTANLRTLRNENYYGKGVCNWALKTIEINYETNAPATHYQGKIMYASGVNSSGRYPVSYCEEEEVWMTCCNRDGKCSRAPKALPISSPFRVLINTDGSDQEFDLICDQNGCFGPAKGGRSSPIKLTAHVRITSNAAQR